MTKAFRRPANDGEVDRYVAFWQSIRGDYDGDYGYERSVLEVLVAVLCSPQFLFLCEPVDQLADDNTLPPWALANRLSFWLHNGPPDERLRALANSGRLQLQLSDEVDRLLDDRRAERFVRAFTSEWLRLDRHAGITIDPDVHPDYTRFVKRDMATETVAFVHHLLRDDLPLATLIDSDFAMLNQNLAEFYGVDSGDGEPIRGDRFRPVPIAPNQHRGGLLSQGAFLAGHSDGAEPHPIKRAVWLKDRLLGDPPPPPPPNVPDLDPDTPGFDKLTLKQQLEVHRDKASCRDCHASIDPFGIAFERLSAVGRYQPERRGLAIDASTTLPDGTRIDGVRALQQYLLTHQREAFTRAFIEHLFAYALGRDVSFADDDELAEISAQVAAAGYRVRAVVQAIANCRSFRSK